MGLISLPIQEFLKNKYGENITIEPLQEEASSRRYFALKSPSLTTVLCLDNSINQDFISLSNFFLQKEIRVPKVIHVEESLGLMVLSWEGQKDLSFLTLEKYKAKLPSVIDLILRMQSLDPPEFVKTRAFDLKKLTFEIQLTKDKFSLFKEIYNIDSSITNELNAFLEETIGYLAQHPIQVFTHRDFHSRNLLFNDDGGLTLIDFQDARMGVPQYDLASIIYDAYYPLPREFRLEMITYFQKKSIGGNVKFRETFYLQALQRSFKALGTYFRMVVDEKKDKFKPSILSCLEQLEEITQIGMFADSLYIFIRSLRNELTKHPDFKSHTYKK
jgi:aminoglycoside/choline kinase family phosphotransferase